MSDNSVNPATSANSTLTPPKPVIADNGVLPTTVWFVTGKKNNKGFRSALALHREDATLSDNKENIPPEDVQKKNDQYDVHEKAGHDERGSSHGN